MVNYIQIHCVCIIYQLIVFNYQCPLYDFQIRLRHKYCVGSAEILLILSDSRLEKVYTRNTLKLLSCGKSFPWTDFWNEKICREALKLSSDETNDTIYGLYFSAHWVLIMN